MVSKRHPLTIQMMNDKSASQFWNDKEKYAGQRQRDLLKLYAEPKNQQNSEPMKPGGPLDSVFRFKELDDDAA